jgi:hypothetical protein
MNVNKEINILSQAGSRNYKSGNNYFTENNTKPLFGVFIAIVVASLIAASMYFSSFENPKSLDFNYLIEQEHLNNKSSAYKMFYNNAPSMIKLSILERFKSSSPGAVKKIKEIVAFNISKKVAADTVADLALKNSTKKKAALLTISSALSIPFSINIENESNVISNIKVDPIVIPDLSQNGVVVRLQESVYRVINTNPKLSNLNNQTKTKISNILKEKIINDITSKYKKASAEFAVDIVLNKLNFQ